MTKVPTALILLAGLVSVAAFATTAVASPKPLAGLPGEAIELVEGQPFALPVAPPDDWTTEVQFSLASGPVIATDLFPPFGDHVPTRQLSKRGVLPEVGYTLVVRAFAIDGTVQAELRYPFVIHRLPVVPPARFEALIVKEQRHLVGLRFLNIVPGTRVKAWGQGFGYSRGRFSLPIRKVSGRPSSRTYSVPGGLRWGPRSNPRIMVSISPPQGEERYGVPVRGRLLTGLFHTNREGNTIFRQTDRGRRCTEEIDRRGRPPRRVDCIYY